MGEVYRAEDTRLGRPVAIKELPESLAGDAERLARFECEAGARLAGRQARRRLGVRCGALRDALRCKRLEAAISPDGAALAYVSEYLGRAEAYVRTLSGEGSQIQISNEGGKEPHWRADGKESSIATPSAGW